MVYSGSGFIGCRDNMEYYRRKEEERRAYVHWREEQSYFKMEIYKGTEENYGKLYPFLFQQPRFCLSTGYVYPGSDNMRLAAGLCKRLLV